MPKCICSTGADPYGIQYPDLYSPALPGLSPEKERGDDGEDELTSTYTDLYSPALPGLSPEKERGDVGQEKLTPIH